MADGYLVDDDDIKKIAEFVKTGDKELANNIKALQYIIDNSNRLNYTGQVITNSNSVSGDIKNVIINGNTRYKKSDGTYTDTWESGVSLESVGEKEKNNNGKYPISVATCGKNLAFTATSSGNVKLNTIVDTNKLVVGKQYVISAKHIDTTKKVHMCFYKSDGTKVSNAYDASSPLKFTYSKDIDNITFSTEYVWTWCNVIDIQLEKGTTATTYESYKEDKRTILLDSPLKKVGTIADVLDLEKMKVTRKIKSITIDGTITNWGQGRIDSNSILWYIILSDVKPSSPIICDKLKYDKTTWLNDTIGICNLDETKAFQIRVDKTISTVSALTTWLQSNPITVVYELATPTTENIQVSPTDNPLTSYTPSTTLTTNNTIKGNISADIPTNVNAIITQQASLIAQLEDNLLQTQALLIDNAIDNA